MATIYQAPQPPQVQQQQIFSPPQSQQDPLFEALVKYITSGPGPSSINPQDIQSIIDQHSGPSGRAYLESVVSPNEMPTVTWAKSAEVSSGFLSTNMNQLTLHFTANVENNSLETIMFQGQASGFFGMMPVYMIPRYACNLAIEREFF